MARPLKEQFFSGAVDARMAELKKKEGAEAVDY